MSAGVPSAMALVWSDDELAELALAADPDAGVADDAVPLHEYLGGAGGSCC